MNVAKYHDRLTTYILNTDAIAAGANKVMFDIFNNSGQDSPNRDLLLLGLYCAAETDVAVTGAVSARFDWYRESTACTGGTTFAYGASDPTKLTISPASSGSPTLQSTTLSARTAPTSGGALMDWLGFTYVFPEETNPAPIIQQNQNLLPDGTHVEPFRIAPGEGLKVIQGAVASVNNYVFTLVFATVQKKG